MGHLGQFRIGGMVKSLVVVVMLVFFMAPLANDFFNFWSEPVPHGMPGAKPYFKPSFETLIKRSWQRRLEDRAKKESGYWKPLMLIGNEIYRTFFWQISPFHNRSVLLGRGGHLFQTNHLSSFNRTRQVPEKRIRKRYLELLDFQTRMARLGKTVLLVISPNLISLYPELVPGIYTDPQRLSRPSNYDNTLKIIDQLGINYVDTYSILNESKFSYPFKLFTRSGSHWNEVGSCLALQAINKKISELGGKPMRQFSCEKITIEPKAGAADRDLVDIANVLFPDRFSDPTPYLTPSYKENEVKESPRVLLVGTSYLFALQKQINEWALSEDVMLYFYFSKWRRNADRNFHYLDRSRIDWKSIFSYDVIILNVGAGNPVAPGYKFLEYALRAMNKQQH